MALPHPRTWLLAFVVLVLVASACGDNTAPTSAGADTAAVPGGSVGETDSANADTTGVTDATESTTEPGDDPAAASSGVVTIGQQTWQFAPRQCDVFAADTVSIWGGAVSDPGVEITFDVFDADRFNFEVDVDGVEWAAASDAILVTVDGQDVTGTATVSDVMSGESSTATFEFHCG